MKKFSELNKINEATYINQKGEVNFLLNRKINTLNK